MRIALYLLAGILSFSICNIIVRQQSQIKTLQGQLTAANATISKLENDSKFNKMNYWRAVKHWQKFVSDSKITAELSVSNKVVTEHQSELNAFRSELVEDGFRESFRALTPFERDLFAQSVDLTIYTISNGRLDEAFYIMINDRSSITPGQQLWKAISLPEEHDYQSQWTIFEDGSGKKVSDAYDRELKKEGIELPKPIKN